MADWDVLIVGAGPAGSSLTIRLAGQGWRVLLLDQARFPRGKICGEYFGPGCLPRLEEIGVCGEVLGRAHRIPGIQARSPGGVAFSARYPPAWQGFSLPRKEFDRILIERARRQPSVTVREGWRAEDLIVEGGQVRGVLARAAGREPEAVRARVVVGADGRNSAVARRLGLFRWHPRHRRFSVGLHLENVDPGTGGGEIYAGRGLYGILNQQGGGTANLSLVSGPERIGLWKGDPERGLRALLSELPVLRERLRGSRPAERTHVLGPLAHGSLRPGAAGALLVGDAARFYDPFTGEGVFMALVDARLAAHTVHGALQEGRLTAGMLRDHWRRRSRELGIRYAAQALVQRLLACPIAADMAAGKLARDESAAQRLLEFFGGLRRTPWGPLKTA